MKSENYFHLISIRTDAYLIMSSACVCMKLSFPDIEPTRHIQENLPKRCATQRYASTGTMTKGSQVKKDPSYASTEKMTEILIKRLINSREAIPKGKYFRYFPATKDVSVCDHPEKQQRVQHKAAGNHALSVLLKELLFVYSEKCQK